MSGTSPLERKLPSTGVMERDPTAARRHCARPMPDLLDEIGDAGQCGKFISFPVDLGSFIFFSFLGCISSFYPLLVPLI